MSAPVVDPAALAFVRLEPADLPPPAHADPCDVLVILGSRSLTRTRPAAWWTWLNVAAALSGPRPPARIITGDSPGAMAIARSLAMSARVPFDNYALDGAVSRPEGFARWHEGPVPNRASWPLDRARAMLAAAWRAHLAGAGVRVLILRAGWSAKGGTLVARDVALDLGLEVVERVCPAAYGPELPAAPRALP